MIFYIALIFGVFIAKFGGFSMTAIPYYEHGLSLLLVVGLYGSVYGIDITEFSKHKKLIFKAVTFGVVLKGLFIGTVMWLILGSPLAFLLGMIVAQIDPLSVSYLTNKGKQQLSASGQTILRAWSSFDDPMTVLFALYLFLPLATGSAFSVSTYIEQLGVNLLFAFVVYGLSRVVPAQILVIPVFATAVTFNLMLGIALCGLFLRPSWNVALSKIVGMAYIVAAILLGSLVIFDMHLALLGVALGFAAFISQILAARLFTGDLEQKDRLFLALAQYNGITSIILALIIGIMFGEVVTVVAAAVVVINTLYYVSNRLLVTRLM